MTSSTETASYDVCIIGLGYVGLTFAAALADVGYSVLGIEKRAEIVDRANAGEAHFWEAGLDSVLGHVIGQGRFKAQQKLRPEDRARVFVITVGTPLDADGQFRVDFIRSAAQEVAANIEDDALVILRSTVAIGTTRNIVAPILAETGRAFHIAMCPERTLEGRAMSELRHLPQIVGADDEETGQKAAGFFSRLTHTIVRVSSLEAAEIVKLVDNTFRDVQFGFANEVARICDVYGVNAMEVIGGGKLGYPRSNVALPGLVGGPCLEKDPHILTQSLAGKGVALDITRAARTVNERQPQETVTFVADMLRRRLNGTARPPKIAVLGLAFKGVPATDDLRGAMSLRVLDALRSEFTEMDLRLFDPVCADAQLQPLAGDGRVAATMEEAMADADCVIIANNHPDLGRTPPAVLAKSLARGGFIYDYWNHFSDHRPHEVGDNYFAVGNTREAQA